MGMGLRIITIRMMTTIHSLIRLKPSTDLIHGIRMIIPRFPLFQPLNPVSFQGAYRLAGKIQTDGGVPITEFGINLRKSTDSNFVKYSGSSRLSDGSYTLDFGTLDKGQTYYFQAFAANLAGTSLGAIKKFTTTEPQFWWSSATELAGGWRSNWVGEFCPMKMDGFITLIWAFVKPDVLGGIWMGWMTKDGSGLPRMHGHSSGRAERKTGSIR